MLILGDSLKKLKKLKPNSIDSCVTDPPYGLKFMNKHWDYDVPSVELWREVYRVMKPGAHLLSFGGTRTYHRMVCNIEDAGFEIRDQIQWIYGSGFPKSHNIGKTVKEFEGFGTALKPAHEPIVLARKPISEKTVAKNVLKWGTGGLNINESRIEGVVPKTIQGQSSKQGEIYGKDQRKLKEFIPSPQGRFPANVCFDEAAAGVLDGQSGASNSRPDSRSERRKDGNTYGRNLTRTPNKLSDSGGASRFFYVAKASKRERGEENNHPTVKPIKLMRYLITMVTPPNGIMLDPFMGSGSTGLACKNLNRKFIGIEIEPKYFEIAKRRIKYDMQTYST